MCVTAQQFGMPELLLNCFFALFLDNLGCVGMAVTETAEIGIIGGTGVYDQDNFENVKEVKVFTPFGATSDLVSVGLYKNVKVAFIPRHGRNHTLVHISSCRQSLPPAGKAGGTAESRTQGRAS